MNFNPDCPVCGTCEWETIGQRTYEAANIPTLSEYCARRYRVLFEIWAPGQSEFTIHSLLYKQCGFVMYSPRPTAEELDQKYRFLGAQPGQDAAAPLPDAPIEEARVKEACRHKKWGSVPGKKRVLDSGGGDGRLMAPLLAKDQESDSEEC